MITNDQKSADMAYYYSWLRKVSNQYRRLQYATNRSKVDLFAYVKFVRPKLIIVQVSKQAENLKP